jgi:hypothetical protein
MSKSPEQVPLGVDPIDAHKRDKLVQVGRDGLLPHNSRPTSIQAAEKALPKAGTDAFRIYQCFKANLNFGATDDDLSRWLDLPGNTVRPRRGGLVEKGLVRDSGRTRATSSGRQAIVWEIVP